MRRFDRQIELALARHPDQPGVPLELVWVQKTAAGAFALACQASGLEDKELYMPLEIDAGTWSRIKKGEANFPMGKLQVFCKLVGNRIYPEWIAYQVGCGLLTLKTEAERRAEAAEQALIHEREKVKLLQEVLAGRAA